MIVVQGKRSFLGGIIILLHDYDLVSNLLIKEHYESITATTTGK